MDLHGFIWIYMDLYGFIYIDLYGFVSGISCGVFLGHVKGYEHVSISYLFTKQNVDLQLMIYLYIYIYM